MLYRAIWVIKQAQTEFHAQNVAHTLVYQFFFYQALVDQFLQVGYITTIFHIHLHLGIDTEQGGLFEVGTVAVIDHILRRCIIRNQQSGIVPLIAENIFHKMLISRHRHTIEVVESTHKRKGTRINSRLERRKISFAELHLWNPSRIIIASTFGGAISDKMLDTSCESDDRILSLVAAYRSSTHLRCEIGIFAIPLRNASPARITSYVHHRRKSPTDTSLDGFVSSETGSLFHQSKIKSGSLPQWNRINSSIAMDDITRKNHRNTQSALLHRNTLVMIDLIAHVIEHRTKSCTNEIFIIFSDLSTC